MIAAKRNNNFTFMLLFTKEKTQPATRNFRVFAFSCFITCRLLTYQ